jgi:hypothetical protein
MFEHPTFDIFIAYASVDAHYAEQLYAILSASGYSVFLDSEVLFPGDHWPEEIRQAQQGSRLILLLISDRINSAYFQQEEILSAIDLSRNHRRRVVPLYLTGKRVMDSIHAPIKQLQGIVWEEGTSLLSVAQRIERALNAGSRRQESPFEIVSETVVIVTGCAALPEELDRPNAYKLKSAVDAFGSSLSRTFLRSTVMGDIWFRDHSTIAGHPNIISIGSSGINALTGAIAGPGGNVVRRGPGPASRWQIVRVANRWALFGDRSEDTHDAVSSFRDRDLPGFLGEIWSNL